MRGQINDQDLANYALNDGQEARERLYVESMLAVSEECRHDVYAMIELGQMLEQGFENEGAQTAATLTAGQREQVTRVRRAPYAVLHRVAATLAMAACAAFVLANPHLWQSHEGSPSKVAQATTHLSRMVSDAVTASDDMDFSALVDLHLLAEDPSVWLQTASDAMPQPATICTPPTWLEGADLSDLR